MPLDPQVAEFLATLAGARLPKYQDLTPDDARAAFRELVLHRGGDGEGAPVDAVTEGEVAGRPVRTYEPVGVSRGTLVLLHGGGWVIGDLDTHDHQARAWCHSARVRVVSVDYRLAPEHPFPAAVEDAVAVTRAVAADRGGEPVAVGGDSAGANLATVAALELRGEVELAAQVLVYPVTDATLAHGSIERLGRGYYLERDTMRWFVDHYLSDGADPADPRVSPLLAPDLGGLPPAVVATAEFDPLVDEGEAYADALEAAGVEVLRRRHPGQIHGFFGMGPLVGAAQRAIEVTCEDLTVLLDAAAAGPDGGRD